MVDHCKVLGTFEWKCTNCTYPSSQLDPDSLPQEDPMTWEREGKKFITLKDLLLDIEEMVGVFTNEYLPSLPLLLKELNANIARYGIPKNSNPSGILLLVRIIQLSAQTREGILCIEAHDKGPDFKSISEIVDSATTTAGAEKNHGRGFLIMTKICKSEVVVNRTNSASKIVAAVFPIAIH